MPHRNTICLVVIFRNEENYLPALIESVAGIVHYAVFLDSSSTDKSHVVIKERCQNFGITAWIHNFDQPFRGDTKRTAAIELARSKNLIPGNPLFEYMLMMDADNTLEIDWPVNAFVPGPFYGLTEEAYLVTKKMGTTEYPLLSLFRADLQWEFIGVIHDFPARKGGEGFAIGKPLPGVIVHEPEKISEGEGRVKTKGDFYKDAITIEQEMISKGQTMPKFLFARYAFYLGNSYRDAGVTKRALDAYQLRISLGIWDEEIFYSMYSVALITKQLDHAIEAWNYRPHRLEAAYLVMQLLTQYNYHHAALAIGREAAAAWQKRNGVKDMLFVEVDVYDNLFPDLMAELEEKVRPTEPMNI